MKLTQDFVDEYLKRADEYRVQGIRITELSRDELLAALAYSILDAASLREQLEEYSIVALEMAERAYDDL